jgi:hypothetical protein
MTCTVEENCSSVGRACNADDRSCTNGATANGLEIVCERRAADAVQYVYCPPGATQRDSGVVWILLVVAFAIAIVGTVVGYVVLRRSPKA